jgi:hypothetical protein
MRILIFITKKVQQSIVDWPTAVGRNQNLIRLSYPKKKSLLANLVHLGRVMSLRSQYKTFLIRLK